MYEQTLLAEREGWLFVKYTFTQLDTPKRVTLWWPLGVRFADYRHRFATEELARARIGTRLYQLTSGRYSDDFGQEYRLTEGGRTTSEFAEEESVPEPKQRGRQLPLRWHEGHWQKETMRGWVSA